MKTRNASYTLSGKIDCEIEHPKYGWIPFTASPDDVEPLGRELFSQLKGSAVPYVEPPVDLNALAATIRSQRNGLLAASDWTQVADAPVDAAAWAAYRQALRDVTTQNGFPQDVEWPEKP